MIEHLRGAAELGIEESDRRSLTSLPCRFVSLRDAGKVVLNAFCESRDAVFAALSTDECHELEVDNTRKKHSVVSVQSVGVISDIEEDFLNPLILENRLESRGVVLADRSKRFMPKSVGVD